MKGTMSIIDEPIEAAMATWYKQFIKIRLTPRKKNQCRRWKEQIIQWVIPHL